MKLPSWSERIFRNKKQYLQAFLNYVYLHPTFLSAHFNYQVAFTNYHISHVM